MDSPDTITFIIEGEPFLQWTLIFLLGTIYFPLDDMS